MIPRPEGRHHTGRGAAGRIQPPAIAIAVTCEVELLFQLFAWDARSVPVRSIVDTCGTCRRAHRG